MKSRLIYWSSTNEQTVPRHHGYFWIVAIKRAEGDLLSPASFPYHLIYSSPCNILTVANKYIRDQKYSAIRQI